MKARIFLSLVFVFALMSFVSAECIDTDGGENFQVKGTATGIYAGSMANATIEDYCFSSSQVYEAWCSDGLIQTRIADCNDYVDNSVCQDGACVGNSLATTKQCNEFGYNKQYGVINYCNSNQNSYDLSVCSNVSYTCSDSDGGADYYSLGQLSVKSSSKQGPSCNAGVSPSGGGGGGSPAKDTCLSSNTLKERICNADGSAGFVEFNCPNGCYEGVCIGTSPSNGSGSGGGGSGGSSKCEKFYNCSDGSQVQYCFIHKFYNENGEVVGAGCGCKSNPQSLCTAPSGSGGGGSGGQPIIINSSVGSGGGGGSIGTNETPVICNGCILGNKCAPVGYRQEGKYCTLNSEFVSQLSADSSCENNFECSTNLCIDNKCVSSGLWQKFLRWLNRLFG